MPGVGFIPRTPRIARSQLRMTEDELSLQEAEDLTPEALSFDMPARRVHWRRSHWRVLESRKFTVKRGQRVRVRRCRVRTKVMAVVVLALISAGCITPGYDSTGSSQPVVVLRIYPKGVVPESLASSSDIRAAIAASQYTTP